MESLLTSGVPKQWSPSLHQVSPGSGVPLTSGFPR
ncbi:hypothetical protein AB205_0155960 [Aquarana catesbeiana]|uniref:Uncharacterized protein n=1 Tax=Aquarana catesbeiana TaxID=8400 RepID=A0A2G9RE80_AQUCT|nr:hypothetical protein AB205_0155960 [Aquarana catesbeiana]